ncbi:hypothetical protein B7G68_04140 [Caulobacter segnis]|uniref:Uncharacterized protein n=1 Tax=Caulobacter segnis TaxID=88688 RepID=A0ABM6TDC0_9CAUL|nr:hypothetical protein B7G68_04140 [Caulobacter segnis]
MGLAVGLVVVLVAGAQVMARRDRAEEARRDAAWRRLAGPSCPALEPKIFRAQARYPQATPYDEVLYRRFGGAMTCTHLVDRVGGAKLRYQVCKFSAPEYLAVAQEGMERFYDLSNGRSAAITVKKDQISCIVISPFKVK